MLGGKPHDFGNQGKGLEVNMKGKNVILSLVLISCFILFGYYYKSVYLSNSIEAINMKAMNKKYVYPLGEIVGIKATTDGVLVIGYEEENIEYIGGIEKGDNIIAINDIKIENVQDISEILEDVNEDEVKITLTRDENCIDENIKLKKYKFANEFIFMITLSHNTYNTILISFVNIH